MSVLEQEVVELEQTDLEFGGYNNTGYPGGFPSRLKQRIESLIESPCLHLFSGSSLIGDERIDILHKNATQNINVYDFIQNDKRHWKWCVLDPNYSISRKNVKLKVHGLKESVGGNKLAEALLKQYFQTHVDNILWFDLCSPRWDGFSRHKVFLYLMGGFRPVRVLTWLKRDNTSLIQSQQTEVTKGAST